MKRIVVALDEPRSSITTDTQVLSYYYRQPKTPAAPPFFDQKYFQDTYLPALYSGLGPNAVRRLEASAPARGATSGITMPAERTGGNRSTCPKS